MRPCRTLINVAALASLGTRETPNTLHPKGGPGLRSDCDRKEETGQDACGLQDARSFLSGAPWPVGVNLQRCSCPFPQRNYRLRLLASVLAFKCCMTVSTYISSKMVSRFDHGQRGALAAPCGVAAFSPPLSLQHLAYESSIVL